VRYGLLDVGVTFRPEVESKFGGNAFEWSYTAANIQAGLPMHRTIDLTTTRWENCSPEPPKHQGRAPQGALSSCPILTAEGRHADRR